MLMNTYVSILMHCNGIDAQLHTNCQNLAIAGFNSLHGFSIVLKLNFHSGIFLPKQFMVGDTSQSPCKRYSRMIIGDSESLLNIYAFWSFLNASSVQGKCCVGFSDVRALYKQMSISIPSISFILKHASVIIIRLYLY